MTPRHALALAAVLLVACEDPPPPEPAVAAPTDLPPGTEILAALGPTVFKQGTVVSVEGGTVTFAYGVKHPTTGERAKKSAPRARVWRLGTPASLKQDDGGACNVRQDEWLACRVLEARGGNYRVEDAHGRELSLDAHAIVAPDADTRAAVQRYLAREAELRAFDRAFEAAGEPARPPKWQPRAGDRVLGRLAGSSWYSGTVTALEGESARISYDAGTFPERALPLSALAPLPSSPPRPAEGAFVLARPARAGDRWTAHRVVRLGEDDAELSDREGKATHAPLADLVMIAPVAAP